MLAGAPAGGTKRRLAPRFRVVLPVTTDRAMGWTRDVSATGVIFTFVDRTVPAPDAGAQIRLELLLEHADPLGFLQIHCAGRVLRVEHTAAAGGVAARWTRIASILGHRNSSTAA